MYVIISPEHDYTSEGLGVGMSDEQLIKRTGLQLMSATSSMPRESLTRLIFLAGEPDFAPTAVEIANDTLTKSYECGCDDAQKNDYAMISRLYQEAKRRFDERSITAA